MSDSDQTDSDMTRAAALASISVPYKVLGKISKVDGVGVIGKSTAQSGSGKGVKGIAQSSGSTSESPVGVYGESSGTSGERYGVQGVASGSAFGDFNRPAGVKGEATGSSGRAKGVFGVTDTPGGSAVYGKATDQSGSAVGVKAEAKGSGAALDVKGNAVVGNWLDVSNVGSSFYLGSTQTIEPYSNNNNKEKVQYDTRTFNDGGQYDDSNYWLKVERGGEYNVDAQVRWNTVPSEGTKLELAIVVEDSDGNKTTKARNIEYVGSSSSNGRTMRVSKTLEVLLTGKKIFIRVAQYGSSSHDLMTGEKDSFVTFSKIG